MVSGLDHNQGGGGSWGGGGSGKGGWFGIGGFDDFLHSLLHADDVLGAVLDVSRRVVELLHLAKLAEGVVPGAADGGFVAVEACEGVIGRLAEEFLAGGLPVGQSCIDDLRLPLRDAEEFPFGEGDLFDEHVFRVGAGSQVKFGLEEKMLEGELVLDRKSVV